MKKNTKCHFEKNILQQNPKHNQNTFRGEKTSFPTKPPTLLLHTVIFFYETCAWRNWQQQQQQQNLIRGFHSFLNWLKPTGFYFEQQQKQQQQQIFTTSFITFIQSCMQSFFILHTKSIRFLLFELSHTQKVFLRLDFLDPSVWFANSSSSSSSITTKWHLKDKIDREQDTQFKWNPGSNSQLLYEWKTHLTVKNDPYFLNFKQNEIYLHLN